jgi:hypothetical protein
MYYKVSDCILRISDRRTRPIQVMDSFYRTYSPAIASVLLCFVCLFTMYKEMLTLFKIPLSMFSMILSIKPNISLDPSLPSTLYWPAANHTLALLTRSSRSSFFTIYRVSIFLSIELVLCFLVPLSSTASRPRYLCLSRSDFSHIASNTPHDTS